MGPTPTCANGSLAFGNVPIRVHQRTYDVFVRMKLFNHLSDGASRPPGPPQEQNTPKAMHSRLDTLVVAFCSYDGPDIGFDGEKRE